MAESTALTIIPEGAIGAIQAGQGKVNDTLIGIQKTNTGMLGILKSMFVFDKDKARKEFDQASRGKPKDEGPKQTVVGNMQEAGKPVPGGWLALGAGLTALVAFMKSINMEDILRLPTQVGALRGISKFVSGVAKIGTLGLGAKFIDNATDSLRLFKSNFLLRLTDLKTSALSKFKAIKFPSFVGLADEVKKLNFVKHIRNSKAYTMAVTALTGIKNGISTIMAPMRSAFSAVFGAGGGPAGKGAGALSKIITPLKAAARWIGKLFLPITAILAIFDGYSGFMKEYEDTGSIVDGIRGAVEGIVDGFIGTFVRLATSAIAKGLEFLGLEAMAKVIKDFGEDITLKFKTAVGGLVDFVTGIFTLDLERITKGLKNLVGGTADFLFTLITTPVDLAIAFLQDMFKWGDPENPFTIKGFLLGDDKNPGIVLKAIGWVKGLFSWGDPENPFSIKGFLLGDDKNPGLVNTVTTWVKGLFTWGDPEKPFKIKDFIFGGGTEEGVIPKIKTWFKNLFSFDVPAIKEKLLDMGRMFRAITAAAAAAVKAGWPGGESPSEAYKRVMEHMMKGGSEPGETTEGAIPANELGGNTEKTDIRNETIKEGSTDSGNTTVVVDGSTKEVSQKNYNKSESYSGSLSTSIDPYWDDVAAQAKWG